MRTDFARKYAGYTGREYKALNINSVLKDRKSNMLLLWPVIGTVLVIMVLIVYFSLNNSKKAQACQTADLLIQQGQ